MPIVTAYVRVSTDKQTLENQRSEIIRYASGHGMVIDRWIEEALAVRKEQGMSLGRRPGDCPKIRMLREHENEILRDYDSGMSISRLSNNFRKKIFV